ncbi:MFS transporter [Streptomyces bryophytorum]|nr:MFS transporter [Actinacidiphila bryophytorum]
MVTNASYTVLIPFVPELMLRAHLTGTGVALAFALFAGAKALCQPLGGAWCDRWGARRVAFAALLVVSAAVVAFTFARSPSTLLAARLVWGAGEGVVTPALYQGAADLARRQGIPSGRMMGWFGSASFTGLLAGPAGAAAGEPIGLTGLCLAGAALIATMAVGLLAAIPGATAEAADTTAPGARSEKDDTSTDEPGGSGKQHQERGRSGVGEPSWLLPVLAFAGLDVFAGIGASALEPTIPRYLAPAGGRESLIAAVFAVGFAVFSLMSLVLSRFAGRWRLRTLAVSGLALTAAGLALMSVSDRSFALMGCFAVFMTGQPMIYLAARQGIADLRAAAGRLGRSFGIFGAVSDLGELIGPVAGAAAVAQAGRYGFLLIGLLVLLPLPVLLAARSTRGLALSVATAPATEG